MTLRIALTLAAVVAPSVASAQAYVCRVPERIETPRPDGPTPQQPRRVLPIGGYTLALTWSPQYCRDNRERESSAFQCVSANRFGFTLHGLWPAGEGKDWPQYCASAPILDATEIRRNLCATPSPQLLQHEYAKHGTCMGIPPRDYFRRATALYGRVRYPDMMRLSRRPGLTAGQLASAIARANPGMTAAMMRITATRQGWLDEVWICLDRGFAYTACPAHQGGLRPSQRIQIWRGGRA